MRGDNLKAKLSDINAIYPRYDNFTNEFLFVFRPLPAIASSGKAGGSQRKTKNFSSLRLGGEIYIFLVYPVILSDSFSKG